MYQNFGAHLKCSRVERIRLDEADLWTIPAEPRAMTVYVSGVRVGACRAENRRNMTCRDDDACRDQRLQFFRCSEGGPAKRAFS
jgi:hypothetical protein